MRLRSALAALALIPAPVAADVPQVATDIAPVHSLVSQVMGDLGEPALVIRPGASPHGYAMRPSEAAALQDAGLVVWVGEALTPWLEEPLETLVEGETLELLSVEGATLLPYRDGEHHEPDDADEAHGHEHGEIDPHAWLDPENAKVWLSAIAASLAEVDSENAEAYRANAEAARAEVDAVTAEAEALLAPRRDKPFVVYHDAYQYLETRFGLPPATSLALSDAAPPPPARVAEIARHIRETGAACIFAEPQFSPALMATITEGTDAQTAVLDPLGGDLAPGPELYPQLILALAKTIAGCSGQG